MPKIHFFIPQKHVAKVLVIILFCFLSLLFIIDRERNAFTRTYNDLLSTTIIDRNNVVIGVTQNVRGAYARQGILPDTLRSMVLEKEDRWFYYHPGINPWSVIRVITQYARGNRQGGASTITQQLAKIFLHNEGDRTLKNKFRELLTVLALESSFSKNEILEMYLHTAYLGNSAEGFPEASVVYFGKPLTELSQEELWSLVSTLGNPSKNNPWSKGHATYASMLAKHVGLSLGEIPEPLPTKTSHEQDGMFELRSLDFSCYKKICQTTTDEEITQKIRKVVRQTINDGWDKGVHNAAVVVIKIPEQQLLAMIGTPDPHGATFGAQINMAIAPRPVGSTIKPLIYLLGFDKGLRPYSLVDDEEVRYDIATGFPLYPKNYDGIYHGRVSLATALANSYNVPAVKVLEWIGVNTFTDTLLQHFGFRPVADITSYQYGIALGGLEMNLLTLTQLLSIFPNDATPSQLSLTPKGSSASTSLPEFLPLPVKKPYVPIQDHIALVNAILSDRLLGVEQFGTNNNLQLSETGIAVKTGTSRDYHDSWTVGWNGDFIVGVWVGNAENTALAQVSGQAGAGKLWHDSMEILLDSQYNTQKKLPLHHVVYQHTESGYLPGISGENVADHISLLISKKLIRNPHDHDVFSCRQSKSVPLVASEPVTWSINGKDAGEGKLITVPVSPTMHIEARKGTTTESLEVTCIE